MAEIIHGVFGSKPREHLSEFRACLVPAESDAERVAISWYSIRNQLKWLKKRRDPEDIKAGIAMLIDDVFGEGNEG